MVEVLMFEGMAKHCAKHFGESRSGQKELLLRLPASSNLRLWSSHCQREGGIADRESRFAGH